MISRLLKLYVSFAEHCLFYRALLEENVTRIAARHMGWLRLVGSFKLYVSFAE